MRCRAARSERVAVAAGASGLLGVCLQRGAGAEVDDETDVGFVHPHAEGNGGDDDARLTAHEAVLVGGAQSRLESGVIGDRAYAVVAEDPGQVLGIPAGRDVDDALPAQLPAEGDDAARLLLFGAKSLRGVEQVGTEGAGADDVEIAPERDDSEDAVSSEAVAVIASNGGSPSSGSAAGIDR